VANPIVIKNRLLVIGNRVRVPGFEPLSEQTTNNLSLALQGANTFIDLDIALDLIPGSRVVVTHNGGPTAGSFGFDKWFEIPSGPPPNGNQCPNNCIRDSYKILQDYARSSLSSLQQSTLVQECNKLGEFGQCDFDEFDRGLT